MCVSINIHSYTRICYYIFIYMYNVDVFVLKCIHVQAHVYVLGEKSRGWQRSRQAMTNDWN